MRLAAKDPPRRPGGDGQWSSGELVKYKNTIAQHHASGAYTNASNRSPLSWPVWCREDLQRIYRNAVQYNTPGHGQHGGPCALLACLLALLLCPFMCVFAWCVPFVCDLCMPVSPYPPHHPVPTSVLHHPPSMGIHVLHHPCADFIEVAKSMLDFSEQLIAQHWAEIQAAEVRAAAEQRCAMSCCAVLCMLRCAVVVQRCRAALGSALRQRRCKELLVPRQRMLWAYGCSLPAAATKPRACSNCSGGWPPSPMPNPWLPLVLQAQAQQPVAPQHDILAMFQQQHPQQHPQAPPGFPPQ